MQVAGTYIMTQVILKNTKYQDNQVTDAVDKLNDFWMKIVNNIKLDKATCENVDNALKATLEYSATDTPRVKQAKNMQTLLKYGIIVQIPMSLMEQAIKQYMDLLNLHTTKS